MNTDEHRWRYLERQTLGWAGESLAGPRLTECVQISKMVMRFPIVNFEPEPLCASFVCGRSGVAL